MPTADTGFCFSRSGGRLSGGRGHIDLERLPQGWHLHRRHDAQGPPDRGKSGSRGAAPRLATRLEQESERRGESKQTADVFEVGTNRFAVQQKTKYARSTKPGVQWGSSRSLPGFSGRGSRDGDSVPETLGCLFDFGCAEKNVDGPLAAERVRDAGVSSGLRPTPLPA
jgi:hypothetical protein